MNTTSEKGSIRSREKLTHALFTVMQQYPYKEVTVTQIAQEAQLSRKTFYRLYTSKEDIINEYIKTLFQSFFQEVKQREIHHYWDVVQLYFDFWEQREDMILLFRGHELLPVLMEATQNVADTVFATVKSDEVAAALAPLLPYMLAYAIGGMHNMLISWIINGKPVPSSVLIHNIKVGLQSPDI